jgi:hypothetical protein
VYQALVGSGFGLGFVVLHNQVLALLDWREKSKRGDKLTNAAEPPGRG